MMQAQKKSSVFMSDQKASNASNMREGLVPKSRDI